MKIFYCFIFLTSFFASCHSTNAVEPNKNNTSPESTDSKVAEIKPSFEVVAQYPHNVNSFTEGLEIVDSTMYESTGLNGQSKLAKVDLKTGKDLQKIDIDKKYFGEGLTVVNGKIFMVTYQTEKGFVFDATTFKKEREFSYKGEGWGMTNDGKQIIMSNGSDKLSFRNATTFAEEKTLPVTFNGQPIGNINELEYVDGFVYANVFLNDNIIKIDAQTGNVVTVYDLSSIVNQVTGGKSSNSSDKVLNGIAYSKKSKTFFITGKNWSTLYEMRFY